MIIRIIAIDPRPRTPLEDVVVYQVPERSRAAELLIELLDQNNIEWTVIETTPRKPRKVKDQD